MNGMGRAGCAALPFDINVMFLCMQVTADVPSATRGVLHDIETAAISTSTSPQCQQQQNDMRLASDDVSGALQNPTMASARFAAVQGSGHAIHIECPELLTPLLIQFLADLALQQSQ